MESSLMPRITSEKALNAQIEKLQARLEKAARGRKKIIRAVVKQMKTHDISFDELKGAFGGKIEKKSGKPAMRGKSRSPLKGKKAAVKYRDKKGNTWAGRGLAPKWIVDAEKAGTKRATFLVPSAD
jgi:DNA-binding protein H-NS